MKIVLFSAAAVSIVQFRMDFIRRLLCTDHDVIVIVGEGTELECRIIRESGVVCTNIGMSRTGMNVVADIKMLFVLRRLWGKIKYDHLICYAHKPVLYGLLTHGAGGGRCWGMLCGLGYAFTGQGFKKTMARVIFKILYPIALRRCAGMMLLNPDDKDCLERAGILNGATAVKVLRGEGVPVTAYSVHSVDKSRPTNFLLIARLLADKGIREYVESARLLRMKYPDVRFHLVGPSDSNPAAVHEEEISRWREGGDIVVHGAQSDVRLYLRDCTVYVLPSYREGTPRTVLEAMATGRAVITTDAPGCRETIFEAKDPDSRGVRQGLNGFLVPVKSVDALVAAMEQFITTPELAVAMGKEGRRLAEEYYDVHKVNKEILEFMGLAAKPPVKGES